MVQAFLRRQITVIAPVEISAEAVSLAPNLFGHFLILIYLEQALRQ